MAGWGLMMGLGQGLQGLGQTLMDNNKEKLRQQLEDEREARRAKLDYAKEQRQVARESRRVASEGVTFDESGNPYRITRNSDDQVLNREPLSAYEAERMRRTAELQDAKGALELRLAESRAALTDKELSYYDQDKSLEREARLASINSSYASAEASRASASRADTATTYSPGDINNAVRQQHADLIEELKEKYDISEIAISAAINEARIHEHEKGLPYGSLAIDTLRRLADKPNARIRPTRRPANPSSGSLR
jgi:hypothetical protein